MRNVLAALLLALGASQDLEPGLVGEYFDLGGAPSDFPKLPADRKPTLVRVDRQVNFEDVSGEFHGSRMSSNFYVRWTGLLRVEKAGAYNLSLVSDDGSRLLVDGKLAVDNGGIHAMAEKAVNLDLATGDHAIVIEFIQAGGEAGCVAWWRPPAAPRVPIPAKNLFHRKGAESIAWDKAAWEKRPHSKSQAGPRKGGGKYALMDHGPFACGTIDAVWGGKGNFANKGIAITLDKEKLAHVCFDTELLRISSGWTGGGLGWPSGRDGIEGQPFAEGAVKFGTKKNSLGWAKGEDWKDPRAKPYGPLPVDWARYRGLYVHGEKVILSYRVAGADILEMPGFQAPNVFTRTFNVERVSAPLRMFVCDRADPIQVTLAQAGTGVRLDVQSSRVELVVTGPGRFVVGIGEGQALPPPEDLTVFLKGGPGRNEPVTTAGTLGNETGAYVVDTLTIPYDNPSKSYMRLTGVDFFSDGKRAAVSTMDGDVWIVSGIDEKLERLTWKRFASGLFQSLGLRIVNDLVHTLGRDQITRFHDLNGDGEADYYENFNNDCGVTPNYHEFAHDLQTDGEGNFYYAKGSDLGGPKVPYHGCVVKVSKDGKSSEVWTTGFRAPNGISVGPGDVVTTSDNQGNWIPTTPINYITRKGQFCGFVPCSFQSPAPKERPDNPLCWIPWSMDNSGGGQVWCTGDAWGPFKGQLFHLSYGKCALFYILREKVGDAWQGGAVRFPFKFLSGVMRARFNPVDGQLYVVGMRGWQTDANRDGCFQRVRYTGKPAHMPVEAKVTASGIEIRFTDPLDPEAAGNVDSYSATWCNLRWTSGYGSDEYWVSDANKKGREPLPIQGAKLSPDGRTVSLAIAGLKPVYYLVIRYRLKGADGTPISHDLVYTINRM